MRLATQCLERGGGESGGDRVLKMSGARQQMLNGNSELINFANLNENKTLYVGAYMVVNESKYTKHYYIEGERVSSKIGGGFLYAPVPMSFRKPKYTLQIGLTGILEF